MLKIFNRTRGQNDGFDGIALGDKVRDTLTGGEGIVVARNETITGCNQCAVQPPGRPDAPFPDSHWLDVERLERIEPAVTPAQRRTGHDVPPPPQGRRA